MEIRCPHCNRLICEEVQGTDYMLRFTCTNVKCKRKLVVMPAVDKSEVPVLRY